MLLIFFSTTLLISRYKEEDITKTPEFYRGRTLVPAVYQGRTLVKYFI